MSVLRWDRAALTRAVKTPTGGLRLRARIARTGLQAYRQADGTTRWEFRPPEEVFADSSVASFVGAAVTIGHPSAVDANSWSRDAVGAVTAQPDRTPLHDGHEWLEVALDVNRADAIARIEAGELEELSVGYRADYDPTPGTFRGQRYDGVQRRIRANHVALLPRGKARAGREARLLTDAADDLILDSVGDQIDVWSAEAFMHSLTTSPVMLELERMGRAPVFTAPTWLDELTRSTADANDDSERDERQRIQDELEADLHSIHGKARK